MWVSWIYIDVLPCQVGNKNKHSEQNMSSIICGKIQYALSVNKMSIFKNVKLIYLLTFAELNLAYTILLCILFGGSFSSKKEDKTG